MARLKSVEHPILKDAGRSRPAEFSPVQAERREIFVAETNRKTGQAALAPLSKPVNLGPLQSWRLAPKIEEIRQYTKGPDAAASVVKEIERAGRKAIAIQADAADADAVEGWNLGWESF